MKDLLMYYKECFELFDTIHFNSNLTKKEYEKFLKKEIGQTVTITHRGIKDNRTIKTFSLQGLVIGFIGKETPYKGLEFLIKASQGLNVDILVWGGVKKEKGNIHYRGTFNTEQLSTVFNEMDVLVVPSIWKETFSLTTLEALSYGTPVIVSDNVGAQDIVKEHDESFVYHTEDELRTLLSLLVKDKSPLIRFNKSIIERTWNHDMLEHTKEIIDKIY